MSGLDDDVSLKPIEERDGIDSDLDPTVVSSLSEAHVETIVTCLEEITKIIAQAPTLIVS